MSADWRISEEIEKSFRSALSHASQRHLSELHGMLEQLPEKQLDGSVGLCGFVSSYVAIHAVGRKWPTDAGLHRMAQKIGEAANEDGQYGVTENNVYLWLSECAFGFKAYAEVFDKIFTDPHEFMAAPFFFTINLLARFHPKEMSVSDFLNQIEDSYEKAWLLDLNLLPALMVRARMPQPEQAADASGASS